MTTPHPTVALPIAATTLPLGQGITLPEGNPRPRWARALDALTATRTVTREILDAYVTLLGPAAERPENITQITTWRARAGIG